MMKYWLANQNLRESWGPFAEEGPAWTYLFGRVPTDAEVHRAVLDGWEVSTAPEAKWPVHTPWVTKGSSHNQSNIELRVPVLTAFDRALDMAKGMADFFAEGVDTKAFEHVRFWLEEACRRERGRV